MSKAAQRTFFSSRNESTPFVSFAMMKKGEWFETWFDTPYYQLLYQNRDEKEAENFLTVLLDHLRLPANGSVLDVACGQGRYSSFLAERGFEAIGIDLSYKNIEHASMNERENLTFYLHDMREVFVVNYFDAVFNFFTSFGYFDSERDNLKAIKALSLSLKPGGKFVIDFFNAPKTIHDHLEPQQVERGALVFSLNKYLEGKTIVKEISFRDGVKDFHFEERVQALTLEDFQRWFEQCSIRIKEVFGDYQLHSYEEARSERMILVAEKIKPGPT
jgi:SAM-dependent methyltransferase